MFKRIYWYLAVNIFVIINSIWNWNELYLSEEINHPYLFFIFTFIVLNLIIYVLDVIYEKVFTWYEKRTNEKYSFYDWIGNPEPPIKMYNEFSNKRDFVAMDFEGNYQILKNKILYDLSTKQKLKNYKKYLELQSNSPRLTALLSSLQTILIAVITGALVTFLTFTEINGWRFFISYFIALAFFVGLLKAIDFMSTAIDRNRFLLLIVDDCIEEFEN